MKVAAVVADRESLGVVVTSGERWLRSPEAHLEVRG